MSSLQKFHRRTNNAAVVVVSPFTTIGSGDNTNGYWLGDAASNKLIVAPKSTELSQSGGLNFGSNNIVRGTTSLTDGLGNTNTLVSFGTSAHPAAGRAKYLSTGGYNTWYLPAKNELITMFSNKLSTPFSTSNSFISGNMYMSSSEYNGTYIWAVMDGLVSTPNKTDICAIRAARRSV